MKNSLLINIEGYLKGRTAIVGIGNTLKADDGAGPLLISRLKGKTRACLFDCGEVPENYAQQIVNSRPQTVIIVDASDWGGRAGELRLIRAEEMKNCGFSTHNSPMTLFFDYLRRQLPPINIIIIGIQAGRIGLMQPLSAEVEAALNELSDFFIKQDFI